MMRKVICLIIALLVCASLALPVFAAETEFVPSITYKDYPVVLLNDDGYPAALYGEDGQLIDNIPWDCLVITPVSEVETSTDIPEEARQILRDVYKQLSEGTMELPYEKDADQMVVRDLIDASLVCDDGHKEELAKEGVTLEMTFNLGVDKNTEVVVMAYIDSKWEPIKSVVNNGDGTVTCVFEDICPVAFSVKQSEPVSIPKTGDEAGQNLTLWIALMAICAVALVAVAVVSRKKSK